MESGHGGDRRRPSERKASVKLFHAILWLGAAAVILGGVLFATSGQTGSISVPAAIEEER
jgi:hypothetical protein